MPTSRRKLKAGLSIEALKTDPLLLGENLKLSGDSGVYGDMTLSFAYSEVRDFARLIAALQESGATFTVDRAGSDLLVTIDTP